ncbi:MAG TPA: DUF423 domain-containing protein [Chitinophaga sp.]
MYKGFLVWAAVMGALAVIFGAFGAHKLKELVTPDSVAVFQTGVTYQFYHVFALLAVAILSNWMPGPQLTWAGRLFIIGTFLFSGSLYAMVLFRAAGMEFPKAVGAVTPLGGLCYIAGWVLLLLAVLKGK